MDRMALDRQSEEAFRWPVWGPISMDCVWLCATGFQELHPVGSPSGRPEGGRKEGRKEGRKGGRKGGRVAGGFIPLPGLPGGQGPPPASTASVPTADHLLPG